MISLPDLTAYLDQLLSIHAITADKSNNGLQVEGRETVHNIIGAVDASLELYQLAIDCGADFIFVHHGESWGPGFRYCTGRTARRLRALFANTISLYAAHLPLDAHREFGHNVCIANLLQLTEQRWFAEYAGIAIGTFGNLPKPMASQELVAAVNAALGTNARIFDFRSQALRTIGIVSGAGADALPECKRLGIDCLITGECNHTHYHVAKELNLALITAGHYKTEVPGVVAVLEHLQKKFAVHCRFVDIPTGL